MAYTPTIWKDGQAPALNAENLNKMEQGIANADTAANQALEAAGMKLTLLYSGTMTGLNWDTTITSDIPENTKFLLVESQNAISIARYYTVKRTAGKYVGIATTATFFIIAFEWDYDATTKQVRIVNRKGKVDNSAATNITGEADINFYALS